MLSSWWLPMMCDQQPRKSPSAACSACWTCTGAALPKRFLEVVLRLSGHGLAGQQQRYGRSTAWAKAMLRHAVGGRLSNCEAGGSVQRQLLEYGRPGWEYHAKGIWCVPAAKQLLHKVLVHCQLCGCFWGKPLQGDVVSMAGTILSGS